MNNSGDVIKQILKFRKSDQKTLAQEAGFKSQSNITGLLNHGNMTVDKFLVLTEALGCEIIVRDKKTNTGQEWIVR